jgi:transposase
VLIVNTRRLKAIAESKQKTDRHDAKTLAQLLAAGMLSGAWQPDETIRALRRRVARRARFKNEILAVLHRNLKNRPPMSDPFGVAGRQWLSEQALPEDERDTVDAGLRQIDFLTEEVTKIERDLARFALDSPQTKRLMTVPGVGLITAVASLAQIGEIDRFGDPRQLVGYLGLDPRVRQSGASEASTGRSSREGSALVPPRARRVRAHRDPQPRTAARILRVRPRTTRARRRDRRCRARCACCSGTFSPAARTTPTRCRLSPPRSCARLSSQPARLPAMAAELATGLTASSDASSSDTQPKQPSTPTGATSRTGSASSSSEQRRTPRGLGFYPSFRDLLRRDDLQLLTGHDPLQRRVLTLQLLQPLHIVGLHPTELGTPAVIARLGNLQRLAHLRHRDAIGQHLVGLPELPDDLLRRVSSALHVIDPPLAHFP